MKKKTGLTFKTLLNGGLAGFIATAPMTLAMELLKRLLPKHEQYPLPPSLIMSRMKKELPIGPQKDNFGHQALTLFSHFAFGAGAGVIYALLSRPIKLPPVFKGSIYGLGVWGSHYLGVLPALGLFQPAQDSPAGRNILMVAAHLVWGSSTGLIFKRLENSGNGN